MSHRPSAVSMLTAAATPNPTGRETKSPTSILDLPHLDTAGGPKVRRGYTLGPRRRRTKNAQYPRRIRNPTRRAQYHFHTQNCDQRGQPKRCGRPRDLTQVRICKKTTTSTAKAAKKKRNQKREKQLLATPLYRLRTVIFRAVLPSRRVTESQSPQAGLGIFLQDRRRNPRSLDRRCLAPAMSPATQRGLHTCVCENSNRKPRSLQKCCMRKQNLRRP